MRKSFSAIAAFVCRACPFEAVTLWEATFLDLLVLLVFQMQYAITTAKHVPKSSIPKTRFGIASHPFGNTFLQPAIYSDCQTENYDNIAVLLRVKHRRVFRVKGYEL